jgi:hypothetical protein
MTRQIVGFASVALFALSVSTAWAQPTQDSGPSRPAGPAGGGGSTGGGGSDGGAGSSASSGGGGSAVSTGGGGSSQGGFSSGGGFGESRGSMGVGGGRRMAAPMRDPSVAFSPSNSGEGGAPQTARPRGGGGESGARTGERAVPRGDEGGGRSAGGERAVPRGEGGRRVGGRADSIPMSADGPAPTRDRGPVPAYSRPREGRTPVGSAVERTEATRGNGGGSVWYDPYFSSGYYGYGGYSMYPYSRYRYGYPGYGFGLGFYDPFMFGGFGAGYDPYYGGGYYGGGGAGYYRSSRYDTGSLRLKVRPADAKVYIDGYFVGVVDSFDGVFQRLAVEAGAHRVEIRADGFEPAAFEVLITPGETVTYKGELKRTIQ